jgi:hypothetical protein
MSIDIGQAFREGISRTFERNGLLLAGVFVVIGLLTLVLTNTLIAAAFEAMLEFLRGVSASELQGGVNQSELNQTIAQLESTRESADEFAPLALSLPLGAGTTASLAAAGLLVTALLAEATSIVAVRVFATDETDAVPNDLATDNIVLATLNGFVGGIVVWGLIAVGSVFLLLPGIALAVLFYFLRQEVALNDKNFVQAMADSWRKTAGSRVEVFLLGALVVVVSQLTSVVNTVAGFGSVTAGAVLSTLVGGVVGVFGAATVTRAYVQLDAGEPEPAGPGSGSGGSDPDDSDEDPYAKALGPDDIPE